jgi:SAM-dependent methyltransferase
MAAREDGCVCEWCGHRIPRTSDIFRAASPGQAADLAPFLAQYQQVRRADGHGRRTPDALCALPDVSAEDPRRAEWYIRRQSFETMCRVAGLAHGASKRVLDVGAGCGWLSHRLARLGHVPVAVDLRVDPEDGLGACSAYGVPFTLVHAHFDAMPFAPQQFDVVVLNAALHYARDPDETLRGAARMLAEGGILVVADSPTFRERSDGEAMVEQQSAFLHDSYGIEDPIQPGAGFLTFDDIHRAAAGMGRGARFFASHGPLGWRLRRRWSGHRVGRSPAAFGVWALQ